MGIEAFTTLLSNPSKHEAHPHFVLRRIPVGVPCHVEAVYEFIRKCKKNENELFHKTKIVFIIWISYRHQNHNILLKIQQRSVDYLVESPIVITFPHK